MIARVRPRFIENGINEKKELDEDKRLYFSSGSDATFFFFEQYKRYYKKIPNVGIQTLTCSTMANALIKSGVKIHLFDISKKDLGLALKDIKKVQLDVIILTSYQGIPSNEYREIGEYCRDNNILLFEDLAHGTESYTAGGVKIGSLSNVYIESYCWDKPYAAIHGGSIFLNKLPSKFKENIYSEYICLPIETRHHAIKDYKNVIFGMRYSLNRNYDGNFPETNFYEYSFLKLFYDDKLFRYSFYRNIVLYLYKILRRIFKKNKTEIYRLHSIKVDFIKNQRNNFRVIDNGLDTLYSFIDELSERLNIKEQVQTYKLSSHIEWNRFSILDSSGKIKEFLKERGVCADNYNWQMCLHQQFHPNSMCIHHGPFINAEYVSKNVVNMPIWCKWWESDDIDAC